MKIVRLYSDTAGESHFEDVVVPLASLNFVPPAPPINHTTGVATSQRGRMVSMVRTVHLRRRARTTGEGR